MEVHYHKKFFKSFEKLSSKQQQKVVETIEVFRNNPFETHLNNHALKGELQGYRSISVGGDFRLFFTVEGYYEKVEFMSAGTHSQLY